MQKSINFNLICHTGCCGYMHDVTMTLCVKMYTRILFLQVTKPFVGQILPDTLTLSGTESNIIIGMKYELTAP